MSKLLGNKNASKKLTIRECYTYCRGGDGKPPASPLPQIPQSNYFFKTFFTLYFYVALFLGADHANGKPPAPPLPQIPQSNYFFKTFFTLYFYVALFLGADHAIFQNVAAIDAKQKPARYRYILTSHYSKISYQFKLIDVHIILLFRKRGFAKKPRICWC